MRKTGTATSHLHGGRCPPWLFAKMTELSAAIVEAIVVEFGTAEVMRRFSDPVWFQSFGNVLGFDWQSSGLTTVVLGALKLGLRDKPGDLGLFVAGGKGRVSRKTPAEIHEAGSAVYAFAHGGKDAHPHLGLVVHRRILHLHKSVFKRP